MDGLSGSDDCVRWTARTLRLTTRELERRRGITYHAREIFDYANGCKGESGLWRWASTFGSPLSSAIPLLQRAEIQGARLFQISTCVMLVASQYSVKSGYMGRALSYIFSGARDFPSTKSSHFSAHHNNASVKDFPIISTTLNF